MPKNPPEDPLDLTETRNAALIKGGLRSVIAAAPMVGGALAQAWSEYETYKQSERVEQFFEQLTKKRPKAAPPPVLYRDFR